MIETQTDVKGLAHTRCFPAIEASIKRLTEAKQSYKVALKRTLYDKDNTLHTQSFPEADCVVTETQHNVTARSCSQSCQQQTVHDEYSA